MEAGCSLSKMGVPVSLGIRGGKVLLLPSGSWHLGAFIGALLPWKMAAGMYIWIALTVSGVSMFLLARRYFDRSDAIFAAALYAANPYIIVIVYWRWVRRVASGFTSPAFAFTGSARSPTAIDSRWSG